MLINKTLLATTLLVLTKAYAGCAVHDHLCSFHALGTPTTSYKKNPETGLVIFSVATDVGGGTNRTVDFDNHVLLPDKTIDLSTGEVSSTGAFAYSKTNYGQRNPSEINEWNTPDTQPRHVYPSQYRVDFNKFTATARHTGDYNGGEKDNIPSATGCPNLGVGSPNCEAVIINKNVPTGIYSQKVQMFNFHDLDDPSAEIVVGAFATGQGTIINQSHLSSGATTTATNSADATLTASGVVYQTINLSGDQAKSGQFDYSFYNRGFDPHASGTLSFDHKVYHDKGSKTYNEYDYKTNILTTYKKQYYSYDINRRTIDGATNKINNKIIQYGKTYTYTKPIGRKELPTITIYQNGSVVQVATQNAEFNPFTQRWEKKEQPFIGPKQQAVVSYFKTIEDQNIALQIKKARQEIKPLGKLPSFLDEVFEVNKAITSSSDNPISKEFQRLAYAFDTVAKPFVYAHDSVNYLIGGFNELGDRGVDLLNETVPENIKNSIRSKLATKENIENLERIAEVGKGIEAAYNKKISEVSSFYDDLPDEHQRNLEAGLKIFGFFETVLPQTSFKRRLLSRNPPKQTVDGFNPHNDSNVRNPGWTTDKNTEIYTLTEKTGGMSNTSVYNGKLDGKNDHSVIIDEKTLVYNPVMVKNPPEKTGGMNNTSVYNGKLDGKNNHSGIITEKTLGYNPGIDGKSGTVGLDFTEINTKKIDKSRNPNNISKIDSENFSRRPNAPKYEVTVNAGSKGNWSKELNKPLEPNKRYKVKNEKHNHIYTTDNSGRVNKVEGKLSLDKMDKNPYQQRCVGKCVNEKGDDGGHLIASSLGGAGDRINLVPQARVLNRSDWKKMENQLREELKAGKTVSVKIDVGYPDGSTKRPNEFRVTAIVDGEVIPFKFNQ